MGEYYCCHCTQCLRKRLSRMMRRMRSSARAPFFLALALVSCPSLSFFSLIAFAFAHLRAPTTIPCQFHLYLVCKTLAYVSNSRRYATTPPCKGDISLASTALPYKSIDGFPSGAHLRIDLFLLNQSEMISEQSRVGKYLMHVLL